ncbi:hypothetical protein PYW07_016321 [Mythimna separata]|uniref:Scavenger receptor class B member 1-like n=1 Tax=Mythimna separata TaxID=271217 RepID=A0AAD7YJG3_MYTSE|nr:hypothetical protein PYW07_016321 [Mythimna separata]
MVLLDRRDAINSRIASRSRILATLLTGIGFLLVPVLIIILDPIQMIVTYKLRLAKGTILYNIIQHEIPAARLSIYVFNITNADRFLSGEDYKLKVEEVGPFVFQEYRWYVDLEMSEDGKSMGMTPRVRSEFVPEASIAHPKDVNLTLPNLPFLSAVAFLSNYPSFIGASFNLLAAQMGAKPIINMNVHDYLWAYNDPLLSLCNSLAPGLVYFEHFGLLDRLYENETDYRIVVGATNQDRFKIKSVKRVRHIHTDSNYNVESEITFNEDTYEGGGYPPLLTPEVPINLYRLGICRTWHLDYIGSRIMEEYGGEALVYTISNRTFLNNVNPITLKTYPDGLMDFSQCYYGLPFVISKTRFLDSDPKLLDRIDGAKPDRNEHVNEFVIDRKAGIAFQTRMAMQLSLMLDDLSFNRRTKVMSNSVIPVVHIKLNQPKMTEGTMSKFILVYTIAPYIMLCIEIVSALIGLAFLGHALRLVYLNRTSTTRGMVFQSMIDKKQINAEQPLIKH